MAAMQDDQVTIIGGSYFQPIADLIDSLSRLPATENNDVQVNCSENGYSVAITLLLVTMLESFVMRVRYINRAASPIDRTHVVNYIPALYPDYDQIDELTEVFVLRDVLAHNHLWEIDFKWTRPGMELLNASREVTAGDKKFHSSIDENSYSTRALGLNIFPTKVGRADVREVFRVVWDTLIFLENKNRNQCYVSHVHIVCCHKQRLFGDMADVLRS